MKEGDLIFALTIGCVVLLACLFVATIMGLDQFRDKKNVQIEDARLQAKIDFQEYVIDDLRRKLEKFKSAEKKEVK